MIIKTYPFNIYRKIVKDDYFHFGLWKNIDESLESAQENFVEQLISLFPSGNLKVLEIGCGLGKFAFTIARLGYQVTAIDINSDFIKYAKEKYHHENLEFLEMNFERDYKKINQQYNIIVFFESSQYFNNLNLLIKNCRNLLDDNGKIFICDEVIKDKSIATNTAVKHYNDYVIYLLENGFRINKEISIGNDVKNTCCYMVDQLKNFECQELLDGWNFQKDMYYCGKMDYYIFVATKDKYFIRGYKESDIKNILEKFNITFKQNRSLEHWKWKFKNNPFGNDAIVVATDEYNNIIGHFAGYYVQMEDNNGKFNVIQVGDTFTVKEARRIGLGKTGIFARMGKYFYCKFGYEKIPFVYGVNTGTAHNLGKKVLGYRKICDVDYLTLHKENLRVNSLNFLKLFIKIKQITIFNNQVNALYNKNKKFYGNIRVSRISTYLNWRFSDPDIHFFKITMSLFNSLKGYIVFKEINEDTIEIGDIFIDLNYLNYVEIIFSYIFKTFNYNNIILWFSKENNILYSKLIEIGFEKKIEPNELKMVYTPFNDLFSQERIKKLFYTKADTDIF